MKPGPDGREPTRTARQHSTHPHEEMVGRESTRTAPQHPINRDEEIVDRVRTRLEAVQGSGDAARLETLEQLHEELESTLEAEDPEGSTGSGV